MNEADISQPAPVNAQNIQSVRGPVALVYSPHAGSAQGKRPRALLERAGVPVALTLSVSELDGTQSQGQRWREAGCVAAVAAGGDGTVGAVATHAASADLPLGILPLGTANDIARALGIPLDPAAAAQAIAQGDLQWIDAGQVIPSQTEPFAEARRPELPASALGAALTAEPSAREPVAGGAYFLHALTLGLNVEFARLATDVEQRRTWGKLTYVVSALESLGHLRPVGVTLRFAGMPGATEDDIVVVQRETTMLLAINLPVFGGRLGLRVPGVRTDDRLLDVILIEAPEPGGALAAFEAALEALSGAAQRLWGARDTMGDAPTTAHPVQHSAGVALPGGRWYRARAVEIETEQPADLTLDGELRGRTPAVARVAPRGIQIFAPERRGV